MITLTERTPATLAALDLLSTANGLINALVSVDDEDEIQALDVPGWVAAQYLVWEADEALDVRNAGLCQQLAILARDPALVGRLAQRLNDRVQVVLQG